MRAREEMRHAVVPPDSRNSAGSSRIDVDMRGSTGTSLAFSSIKS